MKKNGQIMIAVVFTLLTLGNVLAEQTSAKTAVEGVIKQYFTYFNQFDREAMHTLTTEDYHVLDIGEAFNADDWKWYMSLQWESELNDESDWRMSPIVAKNFRTKIIDESFAYTNFDQYWSANPYYVEVSSMVLTRAEGKWFIDRWSIHTGQMWKQWLENRLRRKGGVVERNWYELYVDEVHKDILRLGR